MPVDCFMKYGSHAGSERSEMEGGGGGGTIELSVESVTSLGSTQSPGEGASQLEVAGVMEGLSESEGVGALDGPSNS